MRSFHPTRRHAFRSLTLLIVLLAVIPARATIRTVSNYVNHPAQYTSLQTAMDAADVGDTILVTGSTTSYGNIFINKRLTLIGAGHNNGGPPSEVFNVYYNSGSANTALIGFMCSIIYLNQSVAISGLRIERCRINSAVTYYNNFPSNDLTIRNCVLYGGLSLGAASNNVLITNNLIRGSVAVTSATATNMVISHNLFFHTTAGEAMTNISSALVSDNIFWGRTPVHASVNYCVFNNNITYQTSNDVIPYGTNLGAGNQVGVNPLFVNAPDRSGNLTYDYQLQAGSTGNDAGSDNTDIGVFGGADAFVDLTGRARIPLVTSLNILNSSIGQGGSLNVEFSGTKVD